MESLLILLFWFIWTFLGYYIAASYPRMYNARWIWAMLCLVFGLFALGLEIIVYVVFKIVDKGGKNGEA